MISVVFTLLWLIASSAWAQGNVTILYNLWQFVSFGVKVLHMFQCATVKYFQVCIDEIQSIYVLKARIVR